MSGPLAGCSGPASDDTPGGVLSGWTALPAQSAPPADAVLAFDPDGDGVDEIVRLVGTELQWSGGPSAVRGAWQHAAVSDDRRRAIIALGAGRSDREAPVSVVALDSAGAHLLWSGSGERNQLTSLWLDGARVFWARFRDRRRVQAAWLENGAEVVVHETVMGLQQLPWNGGLVIGRLYGDAPRSPGDLQLREADGSVAPLPSLRGVRSLARLTLPAGGEGADGQEVIAVCDGWHYAYGAEADARLSLRWGPGLTRESTVAWLPDSYTCEQVLAVPGSPVPALVVRGSGGLHLLESSELGWRRTRLADATELDVITVARGQEGPELIVAGPTPLRIPLRRSPLVAEAPQ